MRKRLLGIDFGLSRIGLALSDPLGILASALETLNWNGEDSEWVLERIVGFCEQYQVGGLVLGLPKRTDGRVGTAEEKARAFGRVLEERTGLPVVYQDERFTTVSASRILRQSTVKKQNKRGVIDQIAAEIILQSYLDARR